MKRLLIAFLLAGLFLQGCSWIKSWGDEEVGDEEAGDAESGTVDAQEAEDRTASEPRAGGRGKRGAKLDAQTADPDEEERGFFRGMRQFFGFGGDESEE